MVEVEEMRILLVALFLLLVGCDTEQSHPPISDPTNRTPVYSIAYHVFDGDSLTPTEIDELYQDTAVCVGVWEERPVFTVVFSEELYSASPDTAGEYYHNSHYIYINGGLGTRMMKKTIRHEVLHYLLHRFVGDQDSEHASDHWSRNNVYTGCG